MRPLNPMSDGGGWLCPLFWKQAPAVSVLIFVTQNLMTIFRCDSISSVWAWLSVTHSVTQGPFAITENFFNSEV